MGGIPAYIPYAHKAKAKAIWVMTRAQFRRLSGNIKREICGYIGEVRPQILCSAQKTHLIVYDFPRKLGLRIDLEVEIGEGAVFCAVDSGSVLCVGGTTPTSQARIVLFLHKTVEELPPCPALLSHPGLALHDSNVYIFGGTPPNHRGCLKLCFPSPHWLSLCSMSQPRSRFTPCVFHQYIYLIDISNGSRIEAFDTVSKKYKRVKLDMLLDPDYSISWIDKGEIVILTQDEVVSWRPGGSYTSGLFVQCRQEVISNCPPVVQDSKTYWLYRGELMVFDRALLQVRAGTTDDLKSAGINMSNS